MKKQNHEWLPAPPPARLIQDFNSTCISWRVEGGGNLWSCNPEAHTHTNKLSVNKTPSHPVLVRLKTKKQKRKPHKNHLYKTENYV